VTPIKVGIGQIRMHWQGRANAKGMIWAITQAADSGAQLCVFPELAVTGFHRRIRAEATPDAVRDRLREVQHTCARHSMALVSGAPTFHEDGRIFNSCVFINELGELAGVVEKIGLTPAEETFFARGSTRSSVVLLGYRTTAVLCREIDDLEELEAELAPLSPQIIFWPGMMRPAVDGSESTHVQHAQQLARCTGAFIIQANWPNSLNYPEESAEAGHSVVLDPSGEELIRLPMAAAGVGVFELGQTELEWHAQVESAASEIPGFRAK
jgi:omega-amidase